MLYLGQMSGTSSDGLDLVAIDDSLKLLHHKTYPYSSGFRNQLLQLDASFSIQEKQQVDVAFTNFVIESLLQFQKNLLQPTTLGFHGHTLFHHPDKKISTYIGNAERIAKQLGYSVVADFREIDIANGGQGAPLAPLFHREILSTTGIRGVLNLGGIANLSLLEGKNVSMGFDTGPANTIIDLVCRKYFDQDFDKDGKISERGIVNDCMLFAMLEDQYFNKIAPKSTGLNYFNADWLQPFLEKFEINPTDLVSTLVELSVHSIKKAIDLHNIRLDDLVVCGGGAKNIYFLQRLQETLAIEVIPSSRLGWHEGFIEACAWAWMAKKHDDGETVDARRITGAAIPYVPGRKYNPS